MIDIQLLGSVEIRGIAPESERAILARGKWIALLASLLLGPGGHPRRGRGELVGRLWPGVDPESGRASLRVALSQLRRHVGADAILSHGEALALDPHAVRCDAATFSTLIEERRPGDALELYRGDLLPGFEARGAPALRRWVEETRATLRRGAVRAAWTLAGRAERQGRWTEALRRARQAQTLSTGSEIDLRRLMRMLVRAGDRTAALVAYAEFERWSRHELGTPPSSRTAALARSIRTARPDGGAGGAVEVRDPGPEEVGDSEKLVVLPFRHVGDASDVGPVIPGLAHDIIGALALVEGLLVVARPSAERSVDEEGRAPVAVGRRLGADVVLDPSVRVVGDRVLFMARLVDVHAGRPVWADVYDVSRDDLKPVRARVTLDVLDALHVPLSSHEREAIVRGPTLSPAAYELYLRGRERWVERSASAMDEAIHLFKQALALDPRFALAHAGLVDAYLGLHPSAGRRLSEATVLARRAARTALEIDPDLGEVHATLGLLRAFADQDWMGSATALRRAVRLSPGHASAHHWLGAVLAFTHRDFVEGARELEIARQLDPTSPAIRTDVAMLVWNAGDPVGAATILTEVLRSDPGFARGQFYRGVLAFAVGDREIGIRSLQRAWSLGVFGAPRAPEPSDATAWRTCLQARLDDLSSSTLQPGIQAVECALLCMFLERHQDALDWLEVVSRWSSWAWILGFLPVFEPLFHTPEFTALLDKAGVLDAVRTSAGQDGGLLATP